MSDHAHDEVASAERAAPAAAPARTPAAGGAAAPAAAFVARLGRTAGNRAVGRYLAREQHGPASPKAQEVRTIDAADMEALKAYADARQKAADAPGSDDEAAAKRKAIVKLALSQVGKVDSRDRGDGNKVGAERLLAFYKAACAYYTPVLDKGILTAGLFPGQKHKDDPKTGKPWSWCAIFGVWAIRSVTGFGSFAGTPIGLGPVHYFSKWKTAEERAAAVKPGDMICRREEYAIKGKEKPETGDLNHQCLVADVDTTDPAKPMVTTVNGNGYYQQIYVRTEPLSWYWGFYDALTPTTEEAFDKAVRKASPDAYEARKKLGMPATGG